MLIDLTPVVVHAYTFKLASREDCKRIAELHQEIRLVTDQDNLPEYTLAAVAEGYFHKYWARCLGSGQGGEKTIIARYFNEEVGFVRFGVIDKPTQAKEIANESQCNKRRWGAPSSLYFASASRQRLG